MNALVRDCLTTWAFLGAMFATSYAEGQQGTQWVADGVAGLLVAAAVALLRGGDRA